jgi:hypothetical protein
MSVVRPRYIGDQELTLPEGTHPGDAVHLGDVAPADRQARYDLAGLTADHALFSAAIFGQAGLPFDPVAAVWAEAGWPVAEAPYRSRCARPSRRAGAPAPP